MAPDLFTKVSKLLADPQRLAMLQRIAQQDECPCRIIVEEAPVGAATISHHIKELSAAGLIDVRREGKYNHFRINRALLEAYQAELARRLGLAEPGRPLSPAESPRPAHPTAG
ncbi:MAG: ArsR family transcriptional regulator [Planctomyces sp.]|nr:ArsR family transcriptional regulator [Planctomyces sp.]MBA4040145.1 ArsR family transcriptional regulator [Planctomyces sp.]MBA4120306.1 ArsR family transcriptional regulator [Isosphaera sp.]